ncbi:TetR/AcrR family transcriptional regulator [Chitinivorax sp. B]|uniref:TetR/AcrR family transcriptional regulator n=1 Tax=Chitinivorax sp. B TaxID=2502235 RepID=UPI0010FA19E6|nr:TetR/AcrR family transcriptional regulator [Chitinivorax sp. B]
MTIAERKQREREALRDKILDATRNLYMEKGYDGLTMRAIAARIDYSTTILYSFFKDKDALLRALTDADFALLTQQLRDGDAADQLATERLKRVGRSFVQFAIERPDQYRMLFIDPIPPYAPEEAGNERGNPTQDAYAFAYMLVDQLQRENVGITTNAHAIVQLFWGMLHGLIGLRLSMQDEPWVEWQPLEGLVETGMDALLFGLMPR